MRRIPATIFGLAAIVLLAACGGGGGGGSPSPYTGLRTQAVVADNNAESLVLSAYRGAEWSDSSIIPLSLAGAGGGGRIGNAQSSLLGLARNLDGAVRRTLAGVPAAAAAPSPYMYRDSGTVYGEWYGGSGSYAYSIAWDDATGALSGSFRFVSYDDSSGTVLSGTVSFSGTAYVDPYTYEVTIFGLTLTFGGVTVIDGVTNQTVRGTLGIEEAYPTSTMSLDLYVRDNVGGETVWINDYRMAVTVDLDNTANYSVTLSGRFYLPTEGYVDVSTPVPFYFEGAAANPSSGELLATGADNTSARLTVPGPDPFDYRVDADTDGDGSVEFVLDGTWT